MSAQEAWTLLIADGVGTAPPAIRPNLERLAMLDNVPRKEKQFRNFAANSLSMRRSEAEEMAGEIWKHLSQLREEQKKANEDGRKKQEAEAEAKASKAEAVKEEAKRGEGVEGSSSSSSSSESSEGGDSRSESRRVSIAMTKLLKEAPRKKMKVSKLGKKVKKELLLKRKKKEMKVLLKQIIAASKSGMKIDGKRVILID